MQGVNGVNVDGAAVSAPVLRGKSRARTLKQAGCSSNVFLNELHYIWAQQEFAEFAGPAGLDVSGFQMILYDGSTGQAYTTVTLPTGAQLSGDLGSGFLGVLPVRTLNAFQDGNPDGVAVIDDTGAVCDFISYGGQFTATDGAAAGITSFDIGVTQAPLERDADGTSVGRVDDGTDSPQWVLFDPFSPGELNPGQTGAGTAGTGIARCSDGRFFFNEVNYAGEGPFFVEIAGPVGSNVGGWLVYGFTSIGSPLDPAAPYDRLSVIGTLVGTGGLGFFSVEFPGILPLGESGLVLVDAGGSVCDFVSYGGQITAEGFVANGLTSFNIPFEQDSASGVASIGRIDDGTGAPRWAELSVSSPGEINLSQDDRPLTSPGTGVATCADGNFFINELHYNGVNRLVNPLFVEFAGPVGSSVDLWTIVGYNREAISGSDVVASPSRSISAFGTLAGVGGLGFLSIQIPVLEPGPQDGVALVDATGTVCDFISFGGAITAAGGPAVGLASFNLPVEENSATATPSIGRVDDGTGVPRWVQFTSSTPGFLNSMQVDLQLLAPPDAETPPAGPPELAPPPEAPPPLPAAPSPAAPPPALTASCNGAFINEVHYRNAGADVGEFVELAGPPGTSLDGFTVVVFRTTGIVAGEVAISSGSLSAPPGNSLGVLVVDFATAGVAIPNGGVGVLDADGAVCDFIGFGRTLTSSNGDGTTSTVFPEGQTSFDTDLRESAGSSLGGSIGRTDDGTGAPVWAVFTTASRGDVNTGQEAPPALPLPLPGMAH